METDEECKASDLKVSFSDTSIDRVNIEQENGEDVKRVVTEVKIEHFTRKQVKIH